MTTYLSNMHKFFKKILDGLKRVTHWHWAIYLTVFLISGSISFTALRHNNQTMIELRNAVYAADKNNGDVNTALNKLRAYVYAHMNTDLSSGGNSIMPPIQLKYTYARLQAAEKKRADAVNSQVDAKGQSYCAAIYPNIDFTSKLNRLTCLRKYLSSHTAQVSPIPAALYEYDFISPTWSPDLAGWSLLIAGLSFILFFISFLLDRLIRVHMRGQEI